MTRAGIFLSVVAGSGVMVYGLVVFGFIVPGVLVALLSIAWLVLYFRGWLRLADAAFFLHGCIAMGSIWAGVQPWLGLAGITFSLIAWDLMSFDLRLKPIKNHADKTRMEAAHFTRLGVVIGLGLAGAFAAGLIQVKLTLGSALILALIGIWGISTLVYRLRSRE